MVKQALAALAVVVGLVGASCTGGRDSLRGSLEGDNEDCTLTQGYWKNHPEAWPVASLELGNVSYTQAELLAIFDTPVRGNGLVALAHQLIAAKLNIAAGAPDGAIRDAIAEADALIGDLIVPQIGTGTLATSLTSGLVEDLAAFNEGDIEPEHCGEQQEPACGDGVVDMGEACDDGNNVDGDGCSATCQVEPCCGDGVVDAGEECDDGNTTDGDGCSATCALEDHPVCGDGIVHRGEECDDGNTTDGDGCSATCTVEPHEPHPDCIHELPTRA